ncbi:MAG: OsmC family protein [Chloroflexota bacterium]
MSSAKVTLGETGLQATIQTANHVIYADEPIDDGGTDTGPSPTEMAMGALGACIAMTMRLYAERKGWALEGVEIELSFERFSGKDYEGHAGDDRYVHEIRKAITLHGPLTDEQRNRIKEIGAKCPVHRLIATPSYFVDQAIAEDQAESESSDN